MKTASPLPKILPAPVKPIHLPADIHWLSGEGAGSWFHIEKLPSDFRIARFDPNGKLECKGIFNQVEGAPLQLKEAYQFTYLSHCALVTIIQQDAKLIFKLLEKC